MIKEFIFCLHIFLFKKKKNHGWNIKADNVVHEMQDVVLNGSLSLQRTKANNVIYGVVCRLSILLSKLLLMIP